MDTTILATAERGLLTSDQALTTGDWRLRIHD
jgi:hypothetical protein